MPPKEPINSQYRIITREVPIGNLPLGGKNPVRVQTMTNTSTKNIEETIQQCIKTAQAGSEYIRITVPTVADAENLIEIKNSLRLQGYSIPLIADIHYSPKAAVRAAEIAEKVRINPGNYIDKKKKFADINLSEKEEKEALAKIRENLKPLIKACKAHKTAIRIGVNHGSLSDRIMAKYGDTPEGMMASAMEFLRIFKQENFKDIVISLKASNTRIMIYATRMLVKNMAMEGMNFPLHLGVTEAGDGEDGRIKSAIGIGTLLYEGIGDTIRVSLTEDPELEIPVAKKIVAHITKNKEITYTSNTNSTLGPLGYEKRKTTAVKNIGGLHPPIVVADLREQGNNPEELKKMLGIYRQDGNTMPDYFWINSKQLQTGIFKDLNTMLNSEGCPGHNKEAVHPVYNTEQFLKADKFGSDLNFVETNFSNLSTKLMDKLKSFNNFVLVLNESPNFSPLQSKKAFNHLKKHKNSVPVIVCAHYNEKDMETFQVKSACDFGPLIIDGLGEGISITNRGNIGIKELNSVAFGILQAGMARITRTEFISCPGCGRTLFDLQKTTAEIKKRTAHLKGLKIAIMGCIVNGIGEMADADYGYIGNGPDRISLYRAKEAVTKNILDTEAVEALINLIKKDGRWIEA